MAALLSECRTLEGHSGHKDTGGSCFTQEDQFAFQYIPMIVYCIMSFGRCPLTYPVFLLLRSFQKFINCI